MTILEVFRDIAPEFADVADDIILRFIEYAKPQVDADKFSTSYDLAVAYVAADMYYTTQRSGGTIGAIASKREGDYLALSYGLPSDLHYTSTYGQKYIQLCKQYIVPVMVTGYTANE